MRCLSIEHFEENIDLPGDNLPQEARGGAELHARRAALAC
jgi:hypothetical protein